MTAQVINFPGSKPEPPKTCFKCKHYDEPAQECTLFAEKIDSELYAALDCEGYETPGKETG